MTQEPITTAKSHMTPAQGGHVIDLAHHGYRQESPARRPGARSFFAKIGAVLDDRIHLEDTRARSVSVRARGWKDFPPTDARTIGHAIALTAKRFFDEHPLAELTVLSLAHLVVLLVWEMITAPLALLPARETTRPEHRPIEAPSFAIPSAPVEIAPAPCVAAIPVLPLFAVRAAAPVVTPVQLAKTYATTPFPTAKPRPVLVEEVSERNAPHFTFPALTFPTFTFKHALAFAGVTALFVLPLGAYGTIGDFQERKERVTAIGKEGVAHLEQAAESAKVNDFAAAKAAFDAADEDFVRAKKELGALAAVLNAAGAILPDTPVASVGPLMTAGREIAQGGSRLMSGIDAAGRDGSITQKIAAATAFLDAALPHFERADRELAKVAPEALPEEYRAYLALAREKMPLALQTARKVSGAADVFSSLLGADSPKRYLLMFQNNSELRPTGGFMGSFALVDVRGGEIVNLEIPGGGTYDIQGQLTARVRSPQPLHLINPRWEFQDANWSPDFPTSAERFAWFYSQAGGPTVDGVIAVNATLMQKLLEVLGPVEMDEYGKTLDAANFFAETQKQVELDYDKDENKPKQFIADLAPMMLERVTKGDANALGTLAPIAREALATKEIQIWTKDADLRSRIASLGWSGEIATTGGDYLAIVHANIAGQKTDLVMHDDVRYDVKVLPDGKGIATLTVSREHKGEKGALFSGVRNVDYLRVYVPKGSVLIEATGFTPPHPSLFKLSDPQDAHDPVIESQERDARIDRATGTRIGEESGKTVFGNWVQTDPGETSVVTLVYELPAGIIAIGPTLDYSLLVQKQSGANPINFVTSIDLPRSHVPHTFMPERDKDADGRWTLSTSIDRDATFTAVAESR